MYATQDKKTENAVAGAADSVKKTVNEGIDAAKSKVAEGIETAKSNIAEGYEKVVEKAHEVWDKAADTSVHDAQASVTRFIRHNPGKSLLIAAAAGIVIGVLVRGRIR